VPHFLKIDADDCAVSCNYFSVKILLVEKKFLFGISTKTNSLQRSRLFKFFHLFD